MSHFYYLPLLPLDIVLQNDFHSKQKGFDDTELIRGRDERTFLMIQHWETMSDCKNVVKKMMKEPLTEEFRQTIDPKTMKMTLSNRLNRWT